MAVKKTENGMEFPAEAYAYVPDASSPSSWKLRLWESPDKKATAAQVGRAVAALGKGFRGKKVEIPEADRAAVIAKVRAAWKATHKGAKAADAPAALKEAATTELGQIQSLVYDALEDKFRLDAVGTGTWTPFGIEALFPDRVIACQDGRYYSYAYSIGEDNQVTLGTPQEVLESFEPVGSSAQPAESMTEALGAEVAFVEAHDPDGKVWDTVIARAGLAQNAAKTYYPDAVLREAAPLFNGARSYAKADMEHLREHAPDVNKIAGWFTDVRFVEGKRPDTGYLGGRFNFAAGATALRETVTDAWKRGKRDLVAFSIDAKGKAVRAAGALAAAGAKRVATAITKVNSVDLIVEPSAGGALVRLVEAAEEQDPMKERMLATIKAKRPDLFAKIDPAQITDEELEARYAEALAPVEDPHKRDDRAGQPLTREEFDGYQRLVEARGAARVKIEATRLPQPVKERLVARFNGLARFTEADVDNEIKAERDFVVRMAESLGADLGKVKVDTGDIEVGDRSKSIADMLDAFFDPKHKDHRSVQSFKECYIEVTGDKRVTGRIENMDRTRLAESLGAAFRESLDTAAFGNVLGSSLNRRLVAEYVAAVEYDGWRQIASVVPVNDFRTQERVRYGGYGDLPTVAESGPYVGLASPADEKASYAVAKKGGTEDITLEMIKNDDVGAIRRIPVKMGRAAKRTLAKFVFDFIATNPLIYDGVALFAAGHNNLGAAALDATSLAARRLAMLKQTEAGSGDRLGIGPQSILVPPDMREAAWNLQQRGTNLDKTFIQSMILQIIEVWYWTDTNDWALSANPADIPTIEVGFLDGQEEPSLFVQDMPNVGSMFSNDKLTYKIRFIFGGVVVDFRGLDKSVV